MQLMRWRGRRTIRSRGYYDAGVAVTLCTDGWLMSGVSLTDELAGPHDARLPRQEIDRMILTAFDHAFLPWPERQALLQRAG